MILFRIVGKNSFQTLIAKEQHMSGPNRSRKNRILFFMTLLITTATFLLAGFGNALATRSALLPSLFFPLVYHGASTPVVETVTPTAIVGPGKVVIVDFAFQPAEITVHVGETVEWENNSLMMNHTTTSDTGIWDSGSLAPNQKFSFMFTSVGDYPFHCSIHSTMTGIIHVVPNP
jgi:plastocyanin